VVDAGKNSTLGFLTKNKFELTAVVGEPETFFVAKLPAGEYRFDEVHTKGFPRWKGYVGKGFIVEPGATTYIGRLVKVMPKYYAAMLTYSNHDVEDVRSETVAELKNAYPQLGGKITTSLMKSLRSRAPIEDYRKDGSINEAINHLHKELGGSYFRIMDHWKHDPMAIGICNPQNYKVLV